LIASELLPIIAINFNAASEKIVLSPATTDTGCLFTPAYRQAGFPSPLSGEGRGEGLWLDLIQRKEVHHGKPNPLGGIPDDGEGKSEEGEETEKAQVYGLIP